MPQTRYQATRNKTCSPECNRARLSHVKKGKYRTPPQICEWCGTTFRTPQRSGKRRPKYCSTVCYGKWRSSDLAIREHLKSIAANGKGKKRPGKGLVGEKNPAWKGGVTYRRGKGNYKGPRYVRCPKEYLPMARQDGYVMEHRLVMAQHLGRLLSKTEVVHHIDHDPRNNTLDNLQLFATNGEHKRAEGAARRLSHRG